MKHAKNMPLATACAFILSFQFHVSGADDIHGRERLPWEDTPEAERAIWDGLFKRVIEKDGGALPELTRLMDSTDPGSWYLGRAFVLIDAMDGRDILSQGDKGLLASVRGILPGLLDHDRRHETKALGYGIDYLAKKGDARDFPLFERYLADPVFRQRQSKLDRDGLGEKYNLFPRLAMPYNILQHRVAGTNIVMGSFDRSLYPYFSYLEVDRDSYSTNDLRFIPSVANTGPQAAYVYEALWQAYLLGERLGYNSPYPAVTNIAPELLTMRVWFDAEGKAVCDVDLAKYGISVPGLSMADSNTPAPPLQQNAQPSPAVATGTDATETAEPATAPSPRSWFATLLALGIGVVAALVLLMTLWKKRQQ